MKTPSSELFDLIKSLGAGEANDFIRSCNLDKSQKEADYLLLFKAYLNSKVLDEAKMRSSLKIKNFKRVKHYLQSTLLSFLATREGYSIEKEIVNMISVGNLLMDRSLFLQALNIFERAKKKAIHFELNYHILIIEEKLFHLNSHLNNKAYVESVFSGTRERSIEGVLSAIRIEEEYRLSLLKRWKFYQEHGTLVRDKKISAKLISVLEPYVKKGEDYPITIAAKHDYYVAAAFYYQEKKQIAKAIECLEKSAALAEKHPREMIGVVPPLIVALNNLIFIYAKYLMLDDLRVTLNRVYEGLSAKMVYRKVGLVSLMAYESYYCKFVPDYGLRRKKIKWVEEEYIGLLGSQRMLRHIQTGMNLSVCYFCEGKFKRALEFINEIESHPEHLGFPSMMGVIKVYKLVLYYEMKKYDLLSYLFRSTYRYLLKNETYKGFEKIVLKTLNKMMEAHSEKEQALVLQKAYKELLYIKKDEFENAVFLAFNFIGWIKCKMDKTDFKYLMTQS
ncbi:MAG: hypothetical protein JNK50_02185 [Bacteroidia bacterium]|nr:hypothetical protein [Bacteroidia bacterium]